MSTRPATSPAAKPAPHATRRAAALRRAQQRRRPRVSRLLAWLLAAWLGHAGLALAQVAPGALPSGGQIRVGSGQLQLSPHLLVIQQNSNRLGLDWQSFNIGSGATVEFRQPDASSVALNRVVGNSGSAIYGQLKANGQVFLTNPNGVLFAPGSKVDVGGLVASTLDLSQQDFADGRYVFNASGAQGRVINQGSLSASAGGYLALFGQAVDNQGDIAVQAGSVVLASGRAATVSISGSGLISAVVTPGTVQGSVDNGGRITADGGAVTLSAKSAQDIAASLVNNSGIVRANTLVEKAGEIWITGDSVTQSGQLSAAAPDGGDAGRVVVKAGLESGRLAVDGRIDVSARDGRGGLVETSAAKVNIAAAARVDSRGPRGTGTWVIDPTDFTVSSGGATLSTSGIGADTLATNLATTSVTLSTDTGGSEPGDIHVDADVAWTASTTLTLQASRDINLNANLSATGDGAGLVLTPGAGGVFRINTTANLKPKVTLSGANASLSIANQSYTLIRDLAGLNLLSDPAASSTVLSGRYALVADIDAGSTASANGGLGFDPIGSNNATAFTTSTSFSGVFQGLGHVVSGLTINRPDDLFTGLFASGLNARVENLELTGGSIAGGRYVGALFGAAWGSPQQATQLTNIWTSTPVDAVGVQGGAVYVGGAVGSVGVGTGAALNRVYTSGNVSGRAISAVAYLGGVVGEMLIGTLTDVGATGDVSTSATAGISSYQLGGVVGRHTAGNILRAAASGSVSGGVATGGVVGYFSPSAAATLQQATASGDVTGAGTVGGIAGYAGGTGSISNSSATGHVTTTGAEAAATYTGGAVGHYLMSAAPSALSASGNVSGGNTTGGVIGYLQSNVALATGSVVSNVPASGSRSITGPRWVGGLIGYSESAQAFSGLEADAAVTATGTAGAVGGVVGRSNGAVSNSSSAGSVTGAGDVGGLVGNAQGGGGFSNVGSAATVTSTGTAGAVGGLVGRYTNSGTLSTGSASGAVQGGSGTSASTGGLVGVFSSAGSIVDSSTAITSTVVGGGDTGGLVGDASGTGSAAISGSTARGAVTGGNNVRYVGGLVGDFALPGGWSNVTVEGAVSGGQRTGGLAGHYNSAAAITEGTYTPTTVTGGSWVGGIVGYMSSTAAIAGPAVDTPWVIATQVTSTATGGGAGGLAGRTGGAVSFVTTTGSVDSAGQAGGVVGEANGSGGFTGVRATGNVTSSSAVDVGGLVGRYTNSGNLQNASATGAVNGGRYTGGLVGEFSTNATMASVRAEGNVTGTGDVGGLVGYALGSGGATSAEALGDVVSSATSTYSAGGAFGYFNLSGSSTGISAAGNVSGGAHTGGVIGYFAPNVALTSTSIGQVDSVNRSVSGHGWVGGLLGYSNASSITGLSSSAAVTGIGTSAQAGGLAGRTAGAVSSSSAGGTVVSGYMAGGLVAQADGTANFTDVAATGDVTGPTYAGGLVGYFNGSGALLRAQASGNIVTRNTGGGLVGYHNGGAITDSSATGNVTGLSDGTLYLGGLVGQFGGSCYYCTLNATYIIGNSHATGNVRGDGASAYAGGLVGLTYSGIINDSSATGHVTVLDSVNTSSGEYVGGLVGYFGNYNEQGTISGSSAIGNVTGGFYSGGLVGAFSGSGITSSTASGDVRDGVYSGGLIGQAQLYGPMSDVSASGDVTLTQTSNSGYVGGLAGTVNLYTRSGQTVGGSITNASASGRVSVASQNGYVGGLVGYLSATSNSGIGPVNDSRASGNVSGGDTAGGLIGYFYNYYGQSALLNSSASGDVSSRNTAGGLVGYYYRNQSTGRADDITNSFATGAVTGDYRAGGLVGDFEGRYGIAGSYATGDVIGHATSTSKSLGGLVGYYFARHGSASDIAAIQTSYATGQVRLADNPALFSYTSVYAGGLVGYVAGNLVAPAVVDSYATGAVTVNTNAGSLHAGGLVGYAASGQGVVRAYASGNVAASGGNTMATGGLLATRANTATAVTDSYWDSNGTGLTTSAGGGAALSSTDMRQAASFANWSLATDGAGTSTWRIYEGYTAPLLTRLLTPLTLSLADTSKVYDGTLSFGSASLTGASGPVTFPERIFAATSSADVGSYSVGAAGVYSVQNGYDLTVTGSATLSVTPRPITLAGVVADKVYDGTRAATLLAAAQPAGIVAGEQLTVDIANASAVFDNKNAGLNKTVSVTGLALADGLGGKAANYQLASASTTTASITPAPLSAGGFTASNRSYDGSVTVAVTAAGGTVTGAYAGDVVSVDVSSVSSGTMADKHVGTAKPVNVLGVSLAGADAGNYTVAGLDGVTVDITPRTLTVNGLTGSNRSYNQSVSVSVSTGNGVLAGAVADDVVELVQRTLTGQMTDRHVGSAKAVTVAGSAFQLRGPDAANYDVDNASATVNITPARVDFYADYYGNARDKVYDGNDAANVTPYAYAYVGYYLLPGTTTIGLDNLTLSYDAPRYDDKNVAYSGNTVTNKTISAGNAVLGGSDAGNYALSNTTTTTTGRITPKPLSVTGVASENRAYDGTVVVNVDVTAAAVDTGGVLGGDVVSVTLPTSGTVQGTVANKNVGTAKPVTVPGFSLSGADAGNYSLTGSSGVTVDITRKELTAVYTVNDKVYDGNPNALVTVTSGDIVVGDTVRFYADQTYCTYCGYAYYVTAGSTPSNYSYAAGAGSGKTVVITTNGLYSTDAANYLLLNPTATVTGNITPKGITPVFTGVDKVYDGSTSATVNVNTSASGIVSGDAVSLNRTAVFGDANAGTGKTISVSDIAFAGAAAANYTLAATTATTTASITPKSLSVQGVTATDRAYDGTTSVQLTLGTLGAGGIVGSDDVVVNAPTSGNAAGSIADKAVGSGKPVTVSGFSLSGAAASNYLLDGSQGVTVNITARPLTVVYAGVDRVYNGGVSATVTPSSADLITGDVLSFTQNAIYAGLDARNVGTNKPVAVTSIVMGGTDAANYALQNTTATTTASITAKPITIGYTGLARVYNGLADVSASVQGASTGLVAGDLVSFSQTAVFAGDGSAGTDKPVNVSSITLGGAQAANYSLLNTTATTTATITPRLLGVTGVLAASRAYDGTTTVQLSTAGATVLPAGVLAGDQVEVVLPSGGITTGTMATKDAGNNKDVSITGLTLSGASAANYSVAGASGLTVNITPRGLTAVYGAASRVYDGSIVAGVSATSADILSVDVGAIGISAGGVFTDGRNVGDDKAVAVSGGFLTGVERNNYALLNPAGSATASITPRALTALYSGGTRVYNGGVSAPVSASGSGLVVGDTVSFSQTAVFTGAGAKNVGSGKAIDVSGITLGGADAVNYALTSNSATAAGSITPKPISIDGLTGAAATPRVYDGTRSVEVVVTTSGTLSPSSADIVAGDDVSIALPAGGITTGTMADKRAGMAKPLVVDGLTLGGTDALNYEVAATTGITVDIARRPLTAVYAGNDKVYDGTALATAGGSSADLLAGDSLLVAGTGAFTGAGAKNVGDDKAVSVLAGSLSGTDAANYVLANPTGSTTASITPRNVTPSYTGLSRVYDGSTAAPVSAATPGFIAGDAVSLQQTAVFSDGKNVGTDKPIAVSGIGLAGSDAFNYQLTATSASASGSVTPKPLRIDGLTGVSATDRVYDGSTLVEVIVSATGPIAPNPADVVGSDDVTVTAPATGTTTGTLLDKNVGTAKPVAVAGLALGGADATNYSITATSGVTVDISPKAVTAVYSAASRVYDGSTAAAIGGSSADLIAGDTVSIGATGVFTGSGARNVGTDKAIAITGGTLGGADAVNYSLLNPTGSATGSITPKSVTAAYFGGTRIYDGSIAAPVTGTATGFITGDAVSLTEAAVFTGAGARHVGIDKPVEVTGISLAGGDAGNYALLTNTASTTASITPRPLRIEGFTGVVATNRVYDGTTAVAISIQGTGAIAPNAADVVPGDDVSVVAPPTGASAGSMADKHVGSNKPVTVDGLTLAGSDAGNYSVAAASGVTVNITPRSLTAVYTGLDKVYDGTTLAGFAGSSADILAGDLVTITGSGLFTGAGAKNVGSGKTIGITGATLASADAGNYSLLNPTGNASANITPRLLTPTYTGGTRIYDGTTNAPVTPATTDVIAGDDLGITQTAVFDGGGARNVGVDKPVVVFGITLQGTDAVNYALASTASSTTATITPRPLNISGLTGLQAVDRVYDGTRDVQVTGSAVVGTAAGDVLTGDDVTINLPSSSISAGTMVDKSAGTGKAVAVSGLSLSGADAPNYQITGVAGLTVNIAPRPVVLLGVSAVDRVYDGSTVVAINSAGGSLSGVLAGDDLQLLASGVTGRMADKHVGSGKAVSVTGLSLSGADVANYAVDDGGGLRVDITPRTLVAAATAADKFYDGSNLAAVTLLDDRITGDTLSLASSSATFASKDAGAAQTVSIGGLNLTGADAGDYVLLSNTLTTTASINRAPLTVSANALGKVYGESVNLTGTEFTTLGLVAGESLGLVTLASDGTTNTAPVAGGPYAITASDARGGNFNPANYALTYTSGLLTVTPRPLTIAANSVVRAVDEPNPVSFGFSTSVGGLIGGDSIASVVLNAPAGSATATGGSIFELVPSAAVFGAGLASNYALSYDSGLLVVLPKPPRVDDVDPNAGNPGQQGFAVQVDQAELERALDALQRSASVVAQPGTDRAPGLPQALRNVDATAAEISVALAGDSRRITLPALLRLPLISFDPNLRRLIFGGPTSGSTPPSSTAP